jgi:hypothetical protein
MLSTPLPEPFITLYFAMNSSNVTSSAFHHNLRCKQLGFGCVRSRLLFVPADESELRQDTLLKHIASG